jgi:REP element-mobilizing transposase RayT
MPDHVHLLAEVPPTVPLSRFVGLAKGRSSRLLRKVRS